MYGLSSALGKSIRGRMLEQFVWLKLNLHRCSHVSRNVWLNHRKEPTLVLYPSGKAEVGTYPIIAARSEIGQRAPTEIGQRAKVGNEFLTHLLVPEIELYSVPSAEPVV